MPFETTIETRDGYLFVTASGSVTEENLVSLGYQLHRECTQHDVRAVILDCMNMHGALSSGDLYFVSEKYTQAVGTDIRVAYINPPESWSPSDDYFSRSMVHSRGGKLELFDSEAEAVRWLKQTPTP